MVLKKLQHWNKCLELARQSPPSPYTSATNESFGCLQFLDCFSIPMRKSNVSLDSERTLFLCLQRYYKRDLTFVECLDQFHTLLEIPILQPSLFQAKVNRGTFINFCFEPLATSVFAVQSVQSIHETLQLPSTKEYTILFLEWYFSLPTTKVLEMTGTTSSSPLQRWLQPWIHAGSYPHTLEDEASFTLPEMSENLKIVFEYCRASPKLVHSYILANHIDIGTKNHSLALQESTLGQISITGAGLRWRVLQQCLSHCFYFSCLLRIPGKLSVQSLEGVDELLRAVAIVQLHQASQEFEEPILEFDLEDTWTEEWIKQLDSNRGIRFVSSVLLAFRQLQHADALKCFRATVLCGAWHSDRSQMSYLEMALDEISNIERSGWKKALLVYIWESFVRVHIGSILAYWVDVASGRSLNKGLQPSIARHFLNLGRQLLDLLEIELTTNDPSTRMEVFDDPLRTDQLLDHIAWTGTDTDVLALYASQWPPRCEASVLAAALQKVPIVPLPAVQLHCQILAVLDAFTAVPHAAMPMKKLFYNAALCEPDGLTILPISMPSTCQQERYNFVLRLLREDVPVGFSVANAFDLPLDPIKKDHGVYLYQCGLDNKGEEVLGNLVLENDISERLGSIARTRLALVLSRMRSRAEYAALMTRMPADVCTWVCSNEPPLLQDKLVHELDKAPSITATFVILQQCLQWFPPTTLQHKKCNSMVVLVKSLLDQLKVKQ
ncbi:hypothetical protein THRCLA_10422 [Thraustotheca clavata]|uniref:Rab3GAP regulatory subunit C-terminal domain-containing protein n=1 Tax=Thraustotheca clavata TaxID=74557 RepID=A0A1V9YQG9_9STRA|nr:hypothetical protein THRCLA_10422 [Thraustotheca clavata]